MEAGISEAETVVQAGTETMETGSGSNFAYIPLT
jgi:hypothetical protein